MIIRAWEKSDNERVEQLEKSCFISPWSREMLDSQFMLNNFYGLVCVDEGEVVGYVGSIFNEWEGEILNVAVCQRARRRGIARALIGEIVGFMKKGGKESLFLEVRVSNVIAKSLYSSLGFVPVGVRKKYYENTEDAIVMKKDLRE